MTLVNIGFGNLVALDRVISIVSPESAPVKRIAQKAKEKDMLIDATFGRKGRAVIVMDSGHVVLSQMTPDMIMGRLSEETEVAGHE